ncbi:MULTISPECIES: hypothetical protein [Pseudonocardia]|uniref:Uncharacterized protein n=2 Tax=Pseudonocardia TaxID=1847 RepID=A0A1Y2N7J7_PSEAH|nr:MULTISPECIES: hypothetical protein [Pseudonocardia]OSY43433.1 hypothetical protein BG845_00376 [Pseudonocardia autotrophica]TDN73571.1 hypothetical protein C8E95_2673 [Pseudonocardia autotrophica]BBG04316.1 hypothetical protein Pdca_55250 [Pseudonocardia autotrophica]GEC25541.1 hypothetical protein PSA01_25700 [Pseudonocardia saturnea]
MARRRRTRVARGRSPTRRSRRGKALIITVMLVMILALIASLLITTPDMVPVPDLEPLPVPGTS